MATLLPLTRNKKPLQSAGQDGAASVRLTGPESFPRRASSVVAHAAAALEGGLHSQRRRHP